MALDDTGLAAVAPETEFPRGPGTRVGLAQATAAKEGNEQAISFGDLRLTREEHDRLATFLMDEITRAEEETRPFRDELVLWREFVDPKPKPKSFPWPNASSTFMPIPRMVIDTTKAAIKQAIVRQVRRFVAQPPAPETLGLPEGTEGRLQEAAVRFAEILSGEEYLDLMRVLDEWVEEILVAGFGPLKLVFHKDARTITVRNGQTKEVVFRAGPRLLVVPSGTFIYPAGLYRSVAEMPWAGNWVYLTDSELRRRAEQPWNYLNTEEVVTGGGTAEKDPDYVAREEAARQSVQIPGHKTYEIAVVWDVHGDGKFHDLLVTYNLKNSKIHRVIYNPAGDGLKPYEVEVASPRAGVWLGRGIVEPIVQPVRAINTAVNQTFDSQTLANAPVITHPEESVAAQALVRGFFPGMPLAWKEKPDEIGVLKFPDPSATSFTLVQFFLAVVERLTRTGPSQSGDVSASKRTPASLGLAISQAGRELTDELIDRLRDTVGRLVSRVVAQYAEEDPAIFERLLGAEDGSLLLAAVRASVAQRKTVYETLKIKLTASSGTRSVEMERQNALATLQLTMSWEEKIVTLVQLYIQALAQPEPARSLMIGVLEDILKASQLQVRRLVELAGQPDVQNVVPDIAARLANLSLTAPPSTGAAPASAGVALPATGGEAGGANLAGMVAQMMGGGMPQ